MKFKTVLALHMHRIAEISASGKSPYPENQLNAALINMSYRNGEVCPTCVIRAAGRIADDLGYMKENWSLGV